MKFEDYIIIRNKLFKNQPFKKEMKELVQGSNSLGAEVGEFMNLVKKVYRDHGGDQEKLIDELTDEMGDIIWYWLFVCEILDVKPEVIFNYNITKLRERYKIK